MVEVPAAGRWWLERRGRERIDFGRKSSSCRRGRGLGIDVVKKALCREGIVS